MARLIFLTFLLITLVSCKKNTLVTIQAQDYITGDGSAYAGMEYAVAETWTPFLETKSNIVATGFLDENGYAAFDLKMKNNRKYIIGVSQPDNICYGGLQQHYLEHEKNNHVEFDFAHCGYANIQRENINCEGETDEFRYKFYYTQSPDIYIYTGFGNMNQWSSNFIAGCNAYFGNYSVAVPEGHYTIEWEVRRTSGITTGIDTFIVSESDTTTYLTEY